MIVNYDVTTEDFLEFNMYHAENSPTVKKELAMQRFLGPIIFVLGSTILSLLGEPLTVTIALFIILTAGWIIFYPVYFKRYMKKNINKMLNEGDNKGVTGKHQITLAAEGLIEVSEVGESKASWDSIQKIEFSENCIFIYISAMMAYIIPKRAFGGVYNSG